MAQARLVKFQKTLSHLSHYREGQRKPLGCGFCSVSEAVRRISVDEPSSWRLLPDMGDVYSEEVEVGSRLITFETGKLARFAAGAVVLGIKDTKVLSTVVSAEGDGARDFLPLTVDYREKQYAQGKIPNTFMRREGAPKERELLCGRVIDRSIRPLFPKGFVHDVQVMANVLSSDGEQDPDVMAANASSAALMISDIPWNGPIGVVRIGRIDGKFVVNPDMDELSLSDLNLVYSSALDKTLMIEMQAREISNADLIDALHLAHAEAIKLIKPQRQLAAKVKNQKKSFKLFTIMDRTLEKIKKLSETSIETVFSDPSYGKFERGKALSKIADDVKKILEEECDEESLKVLPKAIDTVRKMAVRRRIFEKGLRVDGRSLDEVRPLFCESGSFPALHGSSIFSRGETQVLCTVTLGAPGDAQKLDSLVGPPTKRFMLHYSFPPFSINEVGKQSGLNRREVGHGTLAEKALLALLPPEDNFPYSVRINSEVMASDGSTSMATVCGGSLALMDAGVPLREHVAGVSVGLISEVDSSTGTIKDYRILTDILGLEDHLGDMDFKIAGTRKGVTAIQLDIKPAGIPLNIICESLDPALKARTHIINHMERVTSEPRDRSAGNCPCLVTMKFSRESLWRLIGPQGSQLKKIEQETGARIAVNTDGGITILAKNQVTLEKTQEKVDFIVGREIEVGGIYKGVVVSIKEYGAFVEFNGGQQGLLHISELSHEPVVRVSDAVSVGQELSLMCIGQDVRGNIKLSLKAINQPSPSQIQYLPLGDPESPPVNGALSSTSLESEKSPCQENENVIPSPLSSGSDGDEAADPTTLYSPPSVLIRSVEECNRQESLSRLKSNNNKGSNSIPKNKKEKDTSPKSRASPLLQHISGILSSPVKNTKKSVPLSQERDKEETTSRVQQISRDKQKPVGSTRAGATSLKLGDKCIATVQQIRVHGLVLQLESGIRGMYRFE
ncbi:hypothetical protein AMTR_s00113p00140210, partial [Amborella trichopoda]